MRRGLTGLWVFLQSLKRVVGCPASYPGQVVGVSTVRAHSAHLLKDSLLLISDRFICACLTSVQLFVEEAQRMHGGRYRGDTRRDSQKQESPHEAGFLR